MARHDKADLRRDFNGRGAVKLGDVTISPGFANMAVYLQTVENRLPGQCKRALERGGAILVESVRSRIEPEGKSTGNLRRSIGYRVDKENRWVNVGWEDSRRGFGKNTSAVVYGPILEFSDNRQLKHIYSGFKDGREKALNAMHEELEKAFK